MLFIGCVNYFSNMFIVLFFFIFSGPYDLILAEIKCAKRSKENAYKQIFGFHVKSAIMVLNRGCL